jgi:manganese/zinc/iron transport system permease protein
MIASFIPAFDFQSCVVGPWADSASFYGWIFVMGFFVTAACGLVGNYLILRRMALMGDAVSHSVLPGLVIAFLLSQSRGTWAMFAGALVAGAVTTLLVETIHRRSRVKQDSAIGITFTTLFAIGVVLISIHAQQVDLDAECVLYGEIAFVPLEPFASVGGMEIAPPSVLRMAGVLFVVIILVIVFYKELLVSSFDSGLAASLGINPSLMHYSLMAMLSIVVVSAFEAVGAILVIAMLILPGATAFLLTHRLWKAMLLSVAHAALSTLLGIHLSVWLGCSVAAAMVVMGSVLFGLAWVFAPEGGLVARALHARGIGRDKAGPPEEQTA